MPSRESAGEEGEEPEKRLQWLTSAKGGRLESPPIDRSRLLVVFRGELRADDDEIEGRFGREDCAVAPPGAAVGLDCTDDAAVLMVRLDPEEGDPPPDGLAPFRDALVWRIARVLRGEMLGGPGVNSQFVGALLRVLQEWLDHRSDDGPAFDGAPRGPSETEWAIRQMIEGMGVGFRVDRAAKSIGISPPHFGRGFKRRTGMPPSQFFARMRVDLAKQMLAEDRSLSETWLDCGYYDQAHFTRHFKRVVGQTPRRFRRQ